MEHLPDGLNKAKNNGHKQNPVLVIESLWSVFRFGVSFAGSSFIIKGDSDCAPLYKIIFLSQIPCVAK